MNPFIIVLWEDMLKAPHHGAVANREEAARRALEATQRDGKPRIVALVVDEIAAGAVVRKKVEYDPGSQVVDEISPGAHK